jgi:KDO2-lipid IV(A) lauroyltransferase
MVVELPRLWLRPQAQGIADPLTWEGAEVLEAWLAKGRGTLIFTPHMGSFEIAAQAYAERFGPAQPLTVLYRPARQRWLRELEATARERKHLDTAPADLGGVRQMLRALKRGQTVGLLPDQVPPAGLGVWAPFFGRDAYTMTLGARLAQQTGAAVGALWCERLSRGRGYVVHVRELPEPVPPAAEGEAAAAAWVNRCMEVLIKECPQQYLWGYNRYKHPRQELA